MGRSSRRELTVPLPFDDVPLIFPLFTLLFLSKGSVSTCTFLFPHLSASTQNFKPPWAQHQHQQFYSAHKPRATRPAKIAWMTKARSALYPTGAAALCVVLPPEAGVVCALLGGFEGVDSSFGGTLAAGVGVWWCRWCSPGIVVVSFVLLPGGAVSGTCTGPGVAALPGGELLCVPDLAALQMSLGRSTGWNSKLPTVAAATQIWSEARRAAEAGGMGCERESLSIYMGKSWENIPSHTCDIIRVTFAGTEAWNHVLDNLLRRRRTLAFRVNDVAAAAGDRCSEACD